jgi:hypothetical protein
LDEYSDYKNVKSPRYYILKMYAVLQDDDGWAGRERKARGLKRNANVNDDTYKQFIGHCPEKTKTELIEDYNSNYKELLCALSGEPVIKGEVPFPPDVYSGYDTDTGNTLLKLHIEKPELNQREQYLLSLIQSGRIDEVQSRIDVFKKAETQFCPFCLQEVEESYKANLVDIIQKILSDEVKRHRKILKDWIIPEWDADLTCFSKLPTYKVCIEWIEALNEIIRCNNKLLQDKIDNPFAVIEHEELLPLSETVSALNKALLQINSEKDEHNKNATRTEPIVSYLVKTNAEIAYYDVIDYANQLKIQNVEKEQAQSDYNIALASVEGKQARLNQLNAQRDSINIAIDIINDGLKYIFFSGERIKLQLDGSSYRLLSNGQPVRPKSVSVGERNIIGLCYFFAMMLEGKSKAAAYADEYLLIIDDPVSSFDIENKVGILSFIRYQLGKLLLGNVNTRAIVMTHDLTTFYDTQKILKEITQEFHRLFPNEVNQMALFELKENSLVPFQYKKRQEYSELVRLIYKYANGEATEYDIIIGNIMRQVLEAFASFEYRKGIDNVSGDPGVLSLLENVDVVYRDYFENLMYRLVLHGGSHREEQVNAMEIDFYALISESEKRRTAKEILCFIYLLNMHHLKAHLSDEFPDACTVINAWCEEIRIRESAN